MTRKVGLIGQERDLRLLAEKFREGSMTISEENNRFFMESIEITLAQSAESARKAVAQLLPAFQGVARLLFGIKGGLEVGAVEETDCIGSHSFYESVEAKVVLSDQVTAKLCKADGTVLTFTTQSGLPNGACALALLTAAAKHPPILKVLNILSNTDWGWADLYKIHEIIASDSDGLKGIAKRGWATKADQDQFKHTACSPSAAGPGARHAVDKTAPPANPMSLLAAKEFIHRLTRQWMETKCH